MRPLTAAELLTVWEYGLFASVAERALLLLTAACPDESPQDLAQLSIGRRDGRLLTLRTWLFGNQLACVISCPDCHERLELNFATDDIRATPTKKLGKTLRMRRQGYDIRFRLPNSRDLLALSEISNGQKDLVNSCVLGAKHKGKTMDSNELPEAIITFLAQRMAQADPQADVQLALTCPDCEHSWPAAFDIVTYFWTEINSWAISLFHDIHKIATAYSWREADILSLSTRRRQLYLEMIG